jgi:hypothetical protein
LAVKFAILSLVGPTVLLIKTMFVSIEVEFTTERLTKEDPVI